MVYYLFKVALLSSTHLTDHTLLMEGCPGPPGDCQSPPSCYSQLPASVNNRTVHSFTFLIDTSLVHPFLPELRGEMSWAVAAWQQLRVFV